MFSDGAIPSGILSTEQHLNADQAEALRDRFVETQQKNTPAVLSNGLEYQALKLSPKDMQMLESRSFSIQDICRIFGIPATFLLATSGDSQTYANLETVNRAFVNFTLMTYFGCIEDAFSALLPANVVARFDLDNFLRGDTTSRYNAYESGIRAGWLTRNEVRQYEGLTPLPNLENINNGTTT
jgi:HK97 family phage portal protein